MIYKRVSFCVPNPDLNKKRFVCGHIDNVSTKW